MFGEISRTLKNNFIESIQLNENFFNIYFFYISYLKMMKAVPVILK